MSAISGCPSVMAESVIAGFPQLWGVCNSGVSVIAGFPQLRGVVIAGFPQLRGVRNSGVL